MATKYIFVTGGVVSSLGKGIVAASLGRLLKERGLRVTLQKFDPYINVDPGTMSPYQHGEVYVTDDGAGDNVGRHEHGAPLHRRRNAGERSRRGVGGTERAFGMRPSRTRKIRPGIPSSRPMGLAPPAASTDSVGP